MLSVPNGGSCSDSGPNSKALQRAAFHPADDGSRDDVFDYIERFYNPRRRHSTLGYLSRLPSTNDSD